MPIPDTHRLEDSLGERDETTQTTAVKSVSPKI